MNNLNTDPSTRVKLLETYNIFNASYEPMFDNLLQVISYVSGTSSVFISFFSQESQFFKSKNGFSIEKIALENSICYHSIISANTNEVFEIVNLKRDADILANSKLFNISNLVSFCSVPIVNHQGILLGSIGLLNSFELKSMSESQKHILKNLANQVCQLLELKKSSIAHKAEESDFDLEGFANIAIHDLKAPLRSIKSFLQLIEAKNKNTQDEKESKYFKFVFDNVKILEDLIVDLAQYVKIDFATFEEENVDLNELVSNIFNEFKSINSDTIDFKYDTLPIVKGFRFELHAVFYNLIDNALKYSAHEGVKRLEITYKKKASQHVFEVIDNGIGISKDFFETIFKPFKRLHTKTEYPGSGLGLAIVEKIIKKNKGILSVDSVLNKGSKFTFTIPEK